MKDFKKDGNCVRACVCVSTVELHSFIVKPKNGRHQKITIAARNQYKRYQIEHNETMNWRKVHRHDDHNPLHNENGIEYFQYWYAYIDHTNEHMVWLFAAQVFKVNGIYLRQIEHCRRHSFEMRKCAHVKINRRINRSQIITPRPFGFGIGQRKRKKSVHTCPFVALYSAN